jgi:uncharacterized protein YkwD
MKTLSIRRAALTARGFVLALAAVALVAGPAASIAPTAAAAGDCTVSDAQAALDGEETALLATINEFRQANARAALAQDATLNKAAAWASLDSARRGFAPSDHIDTLGRNIPTRFVDCGYPVGAYVKENNYYGGGTINPQSGYQWGSREDAMHFWSVRSQGHKDTLLDANLRYIGVARECLNGMCYFTLTFGSVAGPGQPPAPPAAQPPGVETRRGRGCQLTGTCGVPPAVDTRRGRGCQLTGTCSD